MSPFPANTGHLSLLYSSNQLVAALQDVQVQSLGPMACPDVAFPSLVMQLAESSHSVGGCLDFVSSWRFPASLKPAIRVLQDDKALEREAGTSC